MTLLATTDGVHCIFLNAISDSSTAEEKRLFMDEIKVMKKVSDCSNPHVLKMIGCVTTTHPLMLVLQFVPLGNLKDHLKTQQTVANVRNATVMACTTI